MVPRPCRLRLTHQLALLIPLLLLLLFLRGRTLDWLPQQTVLGGTCNQR